MQEKEVLDVVTPNDTVIAKAARGECHKNNLRHRAVHVILFNTKGHVFVQKRSKTKDVYPGKFEGSLSGHVKTGETCQKAALRELEEELGVKNHNLNEVAGFKIRVPPEHEIVKVFTLRCDCIGKIDKSEVESGKFVPYNKLKLWMREKPEEFTPGFLIAMDKYEEATESKGH